MRATISWSTPTPLTWGQRFEVHVGGGFSRFQWALLWPPPLLSSRYHPQSSAWMHEWWTHWLYAGSCGLLHTNCTLQLTLLLFELDSVVNNRPISIRINRAFLQFNLIINCQKWLYCLPATIKMAIFIEFSKLKFLLESSLSK